MLDEEYVAATLRQEVRTTDNSQPLRPCSRSFKVVDFCWNRKPIYEFLLVINCHLSYISHRFWDTASKSRKPSHPTLSLQIEGPLRILSSNFAGLELRHWLHFSENRMILTAAVLSQYTRVTDRRQTTYYDNSRTFHCNGRLKINMIQSTAAAEVFRCWAAKVE